MSLYGFCFWVFGWPVFLLLLRWKALANIITISECSLREKARILWNFLF